MKVHKKVYQIPSGMAWVQRPSGLIKMEGSPLVYTNSQIRSDFCFPSKKDRKISIFPSNFVQSDPILAVRVNRG